ncbi:MAG: hypothetical protein N4A46_10690, partial [Schleiferiaceae bacterium]|nr:hypothetical protein [Schleiferiaceae bacterium]
MKNLILLSFILLVAYSNGLQCQVELGPDLTSCPEDSIYLGQNLSIAGMVAPYAYSWESYNSWQIGSSFIETYASDYLDDTTIANPQIVNREQEPLRFILTVTDANGLQCKDSLEVHFSWFMFTLAGPKVEYINQGDSVWLSGMQNIVGMLPPFT